MSYTVDEENCVVNLIDNKTKETNILNISFKEAYENISLESVDYSSQITFNVSNEIIMNVYAGLRIKEQFSTYYDDEQVLNFYVRYNYDKDLNKGYFSLELINKKEFRHLSKFLFIIN